MPLGPRTPLLAALVAAVLWAAPATAQPPYSAVIKGGRVIDPKNGRDGVMDLAAGKVAEVAPSIDAAKAIRLVDAAGLYVVPAVLAVRRGDFGFLDSSGGRMKATQKLECEVTIRAGQVLWDLNGRAAPDWSTMPVVPQGSSALPPRRSSSQK